MDSIIRTNMSAPTFGQCFKDSTVMAIKDILTLFYIISPNDSTYEDPYDVPGYEVKLLVATGTLAVLEQIIRYCQRKDLVRIQDYVINVGTAIILGLMRAFLLTTSVAIFIWVHSNYRLLDLPLHSTWTWLFSLLVVEFTYYWTHRALHEFNILWAAHQFHHMAEDINITTTVRDSVVDLFIYSIFPLPLGILIPPQIIMVHVQLSLLYQMWLHNSVVGNLGFLEYIINTPRQHRVHHGKNRYCIDKNYGALIMVWDRLFGTHQTEKEKIIYGVVSPTPKTYDPTILSFGYYRDVWQKFCKMDGFCNKMSALFKGPGWTPGKPRLGDINDVPEVDYTEPKYSHNPFISDWRKLYVAYHGIIMVLGFYMLGEHPYLRFSPGKGLIAAIYVVYLLTSFGAIFDNRSWAAPLEISRCLAYFAFDYFLIYSVQWPIGAGQYLLLNILMWSTRAAHVLSMLFWFVYCCKHRSSDTSADNESTEYTDVKDMESETSSKIRRNGFKAIIFILCFLIAALAFIIAFMSRLDNCNKMFNYFYYFLHV